MNVVNLLWNAAKEAPDKDAIIFKQERYTWREVYLYSHWLKERLIQLGIKRNDRVGIFIPHNFEQVVALFGVLMADAVFTIISHSLKTGQIEHQINDSEISLILTFDPVSVDLDAFLQRKRIQNLVISLDYAVIDKCCGIPDYACRNIPSDVACLIYTSGSTGRPKGVVVPHRTLSDGARIVSGYLGITSDDVILSLLPFGFDYGLNQLLSVVYKKAKLVISFSKLPHDVLCQIGQYSITGFAAVPSMWWHFFNPRLVSSSAEYKLNTLRYITSGGGKHPRLLVEKLHRFFIGTEIIIMYGLTESFRSSFLPASEALTRIGSIGKAVPEVELLVLDEKGEECPPGVKGELYHRGAFITYGYLNNHDATKKRFVEFSTAGPGCMSEIVVRSGDIVSKDEEGYLYFHERNDSQIKCSGYRISPSEVEEVALLIPGLKMAAVFGLEDLYFGEVVCLAYSTFTGDQIDEGNMKKVFIEHLPTYSTPKKIIFFEELPTTVSGKVDYTELKNLVHP